MKYENALYLVGTPIGNLDDISPRALETLRTVDFIAAEDTRVTAKLLNHFNIQKPMLSSYRHNEKQRAVEIVRRVEAGEKCALVTDAGMPAISDPGEEVSRLCAEKGIKILAVPGPSAIVCAIALSGLPCGRFTFEGFLSVNKSSRLAHLTSLQSEIRTMVFYEAPHKLKRTLTDLQCTFGSNRKIAISRELTKIHEETLHMTLGQAVSYYEQTEPRGEFVLVVEGTQASTLQPEVSEESVLATVDAMVHSGKSKNTAIKYAAEKFKLPRNQVYQLVLDNRK